MGPDYVAIWIGRILLALIVSGLWIWILRSLGRILRGLVAFIDTRLRQRGKGFHFRSVEVLGVDSIIAFFKSLIGMTRGLGSLAVTYLWILVVAWALDPNRRVFGVVVQPLITVVSSAFEALLAFIPNLVMLIIIFSLARFTTRSLRVLIDAVANRRLELDWLEPELAIPTRRIATIGIWVLALVMAAPYLPGSESKAFLGVAIMLGVLLALGARSVTSNLLAGLVLTYARTYRAGDRVRIGDTTGEVLTLGALTTRLRTDDNREVVIPNAVAQAGTITHLVSRPRSLSTINAFEFVRSSGTGASEHVPLPAPLPDSKGDSMPDSNEAGLPLISPLAPDAKAPASISGLNTALPPTSFNMGSASTLPGLTPQKLGLPDPTPPKPGLPDPTPPKTPSRTGTAPMSAGLPGPTPPMPPRPVEKPKGDAP